MNQDSAPAFAVYSGSIGRHLWPWFILAFLLLVVIAGGTPRYGSFGDVPLGLISLPIILIATLLPG